MGLFDASTFNPSGGGGWLGQYFGGLQNGAYGETPQEQKAREYQLLSGLAGGPIMDAPASPFDQKNPAIAYGGAQPQMPPGGQFNFGYGQTQQPPMAQPQAMPQQPANSPPQQAMPSPPQNAAQPIFGPGMTDASAYSGMRSASGQPTMAWSGYSPSDQSQLPPNARPTQAQSPQTVPQALGIGDRLNAGFQGFANAGSPMEALGNLVGGLGTGQRMDPKGIAQTNQGATAGAIYSGLMSGGQYTPEQAKGLAVAASTNPALAQAVLGQALGPKAAPTTKDIETPIGKRTVAYDPRTQQWNDVLTGKPIIGNAQAPQQSGNPAFTAGPIPVGVDPDKYRQDEAARIADAQKEMRTKAEGSLEFLPDAVRVMDRIKSGKYDNAIGPIEGNSIYNEYVRGLGGALDPTGTARKNLGDYNELNADMKRLSTSNLKSQFGGRITNIEIGQNNQTFGGAQSASPETAHNILSKRVEASFEMLQRSIDSGLISPNAVPKDVAQRGVDMGVLNPKTFGLQPSQKPQPAQGGDGWVPIGNGVRIREKK